MSKAKQGLAGRRDGGDSFGPGPGSRSRTDACDNSDKQSNPHSLTTQSYCLPVGVPPWRVANLGPELLDTKCINVLL